MWGSGQWRANDKSKHTLCRSHKRHVTHKHDMFHVVFPELIVDHPQLRPARGTLGAFLYRDVRGLVPYDNSRRFGAFESASVWI